MARTPGSNTLLYLTMNGDTIDHSGKSTAITTQGTLNYTTLSSGKKVLNFGGSTGVRTTNKLSASTNTKYTINVWVKSSGTHSVDRCVFGYGYDNGNYGIKFACSGSSNSYRCFYGGGNNNWYGISEGYSALSTTNLDLMTYVIDGNKIIRYKNGSYVSQGTYSANVNTNLAMYVSIGGEFGHSSSDTDWHTIRYFYGQIGEVILENKTRTATEVQNYFNNTAWQYGLAPKPTILYCSSPIKEIYLGNPGGGRLPSAYQEVEYIQSSGTQHINTGYYHTANTEVEIKFNHQSSGGTYDFYGIYGGRTTYNSADCLAIWSKSGSYLGYGIGGIYSDTFKSISRDTDYTVKFNKSSITVNGAVTTRSTSLTSCSYQDYIFCMNNSGSITDYKISAKIYYCKVSENGTLKRNFVPCYRKSDNVIGLYDLVEGKFYTNSGSGTFTKGANVTQDYTPIKEVRYSNSSGELKKIRPAGWTPGSNTVAYYPLTTNANDYSGNGYNGTVAGTAITYGKIGGSSKVAGFLSGTRVTTSLTTLPKTINIWVYKPSNSSDPRLSDWKQLFGFNSQDSGNAIIIRGTTLNGSNGKFYMQVGNSMPGYAYGNAMDQRINLCVVTDGSTRLLYINGVQRLSASGGFGTAQTGFWFGTSPYDSLTSYYSWRGYMSEIILEKVARTAAEVSDYYNNTKTDYGL